MPKHNTKYISFTINLTTAPNWIGNMIFQFLEREREKTEREIEFASREWSMEMQRNFRRNGNFQFICETTQNTTNYSKLINSIMWTRDPQEIWIMERYHSIRLIPLHDEWHRMVRESSAWFRINSQIRISVLSSKLSLFEVLCCLSNIRMICAPVFGVYEFIID